MKTNLPGILLITVLLAACSGHKTIKNDLVEMGLKGKVKSLTETSYYAKALPGTIAKGKEGEQEFPWTDSRYSFNADGNFIEHNAYNPGGALVFQQHYKYDSKGLKTEVTYHYNLGNDSLRERSEYTYDSAGKLTDLRTFDLIGYLDRRFAYKYDTEGNLTKTISYDYDDNVDSTAVSKFDSKGNCIETISRNADSSIRFKTTATWDKKGNKLEFSYFNADGSLRFKTICKYDEKGNKTEYAKYIAGSLADRETYRYDKKGFLAEQEVFVADGRLKTKLTFEYVYDAENNWIKRMELNFNIPKYTVERKIEYYN